MKKADFEKNIRAAMSFLFDEMDMGESVMSCSSFNACFEFKLVSRNPESAYEEVYQSAIDLKQYNFSLIDRALFQFGWQSESEWRLAFYPNPWLTGVASAVSTVSSAKSQLRNGSIDLDEFDTILSSLEVERSEKQQNSAPPIRFDCALNKNRNMLHPSAHFHVGHYAQSRWGVTQKLSPLAFVMIISKHYYPCEWNVKSSYGPQSVTNCVDMSLIKELGKCYAVPDFCEWQAKTLHFCSRI